MNGAAPTVAEIRAHMDAGGLLERRSPWLRSDAYPHIADRRWDRMPQTMLVPNYRLVAR